MTFRSKSNQHGQAALQDDDLMASAIGDLGWLKLALRHKPTGTSSVDKNGFSSIHLAAMHGRVDCLRYLIETHNIDVNLPSVNGWRPIHLAISNQTGKRAFESFVYLLEKGADPVVSNEDGVTPLHQAASEGHIQCLKVLLDMQVPIDIQDNRGNTPFDLARLWGHRMCAKLLTQAIWHRDKRDVSLELEAVRRKRLVEAIREIHDLQQSIINKQRKELERLRDTKSKVENANLKVKPSANQTPLKSKASEYPRYCRDNLPISADIRKAIQVVSRQDVADPLPASSRPLENANDPTESSSFFVPVRWNPSTKVTATFAPYEPSLKDIYPRDPFSNLPLPDATPTELNPMVKNAIGAIGREMPNGQPSRRLRSAIAEAENESSTSPIRRKSMHEKLATKQPTIYNDLQLRPNVWRSNHVYDVSKLKKRAQAMPVSDAGFCLTNDPNSYQIRNSLCIDPSI